MNPLIFACAVLLVAQLGLAGLTILHDRPNETHNPAGPLFTIPATAVDELLLADEMGGQLVLKKEKEGWVLPNLANFPADASRVQRLLDQLLSTQRGWPEATTAEAAGRFKVAADRFERRLTLRGKDQDLARIYIGTSLGLRKVSTRLDKDSHIQALPLDPRQLELAADSWIDTGILRLEAKQIKAIDLPPLRFARQGDTMQPADMRADEEPIRDRIEALVKAVAELRIIAVLGPETWPAHEANTQTLRFTVQMTGGHQIDYLLAQEHPISNPTTPATAPQTPTESTALLKVSGRDEVFRVDGWQVEDIRKATRTALIKPSTAAPTTDGTN